MKRGEVWDSQRRFRIHLGKPRPAVIIQDDRFDATESITLCPFTTDRLDAPLLRLAIEPTDQNGLRQASQLMSRRSRRCRSSASGRGSAVSMTTKW